MKLVSLALLLLPWFVARAAPTELPTPAAPGALAPTLSLGPDQVVRLAWLEPTGADTWALRLSRLAADASAWEAPGTIAAGAGWLANWADTPHVTPLADDTLMAVWYVRNPATGHAHAGHHGAGYHACYSVSHDHGRTWSAPQRTTGESTSVEFLSVLALGENSRALVAWLDGRTRAAGPDQQALYAQTFLASGPDRLVEARVCDCCPLSLVSVPGGALLAYRGRSTDEVRDIRLARWQDGAWQPPTDLHADGWRIKGCPVNGPRLAAAGDLVAAAWYTAAQDQPRVQLKRSRDGGRTWSDSVRVDLGRPQGRVDCLLRPDGTALVTWLELAGTEGSREGGIYLRTLDPGGQLGPPRLLAATTTARASGIPRALLLRDGRLLLAHTVDAEPTRITTLLVSLD